MVPSARTRTCSHEYKTMRSRHSDRKRTWAEQIDCDRRDAALAEYRRHIYQDLVKRVDVASLSVLNLIDMDEGRRPLRSWKIEH